MTIHVLGQVALGFAVSVPQIGSAILASAFLEVAINAYRLRRLAWPASAMLTGSGVGLIMRVEGTVAGQHWSWHRWWWFSVVAAASLLTKYVIRWRGTHLFNPSNLGLVVAFLVLGPSQVEPLPFHWSGPGPGLVVAYVVIVVGGSAITHRLRLLAMAVVFWCTLGVGLAALAWSGHCMTVPWDVRPTCGGRFWASVLLSPEVLVFMYFMLTDPRTVPAGRLRRLVFASFVAMAACLMIAPQRTEFGAKVALLGALSLACASRPVVALLGRRITAFHRATRSLSADQRGLLVGIAAATGFVLFLAGTVAAGGGARTAQAAVEIDERFPPIETLLSWTPPATLPAITFDDFIDAFDETLRSPDGRTDVVVAMLRGLAVESELLRRGDAKLLGAVDHGTRLDELRSMLALSPGGRVEESPKYTATAAHLSLRRAGRQSSPVLSIAVDGSATTTADGTTEWTAIIWVRRASDGRWLIVQVTDGEARSDRMSP